MNTHRISWMPDAKVLYRVMNRSGIVKQIPLLISIAVTFAFAAPPLLAQNGVATDVYRLENENIQVSLRKDIPMITTYRLKAGNHLLPAGISGSGPGISFYKDGDQVVSNWTTIRYTAIPSPDNRRVTYHGLALYQDVPAIEFDLIYALSPYGIDITYDNVVEHENFYLIYILLPELITAKAEDPVARLAIPADAGRLIDVKVTTPGELEYEIDWLHPVLTGLAYNG